MSTKKCLPKNVYQKMYTKKCIPKNVYQKMSTKNVYQKMSTKKICLSKNADQNFGMSYTQYVDFCLILVVKNFAFAIR